METKICTKCKTEKELTKENYYWHSSRQYFMPTCKECQKARNRELWGTDSEYKAKRKATLKQWQDESKRYVHTYLQTHPCVDCGETDLIVLAFDHIDPSTKKKAIAVLVQSYHPDVVKAEIEKCEVRCSNCHIRKTSKQFNWWKNNY